VVLISCLLSAALQDMLHRQVQSMCNLACPAHNIWSTQKGFQDLRLQHKGISSAHSYSPHLTSVEAASMPSTRSNLRPALQVKPRRSGEEKIHAGAVEILREGLCMACLWLVGPRKTCTWQKASDVACKAINKCKHMSGVPKAILLHHK
jgi:hypothetical protein